MYKTLAYIIGFNDVMNKLSIKLYHQMQTFVLEGVSINTLASILTYESSPSPCLPSIKYQWHDKGGYSITVARPFRIYTWFLINYSYK